MSLTIETSADFSRCRSYRKNRSLFVLLLVFESKQIVLLELHYDTSQFTPWVISEKSEEIVIAITLGKAVAFCIGIFKG